MASTANFIDPAGPSRLRRRPIRSTAIPLLISASALLLGAAPARSQAAFHGSADIRLGDRVHAAFPDPARGPHRYMFFALAGQAVRASVEADPGSSLLPGLRLAHPGGAATDPDPRTTRSGRRARLGGFRAPYAGWFQIEVLPLAGSGGYLLSTRGPGGRRLATLYPDAPADATHAFHGPAGARVTATVSPRRRGPLLEVTGIEAPDGTPIPVLSLQDGASATVRRVLLPADGRHVLAWRNLGSPGDVLLDLRFELPAPPSSPLDLGTSEGAPLAEVERGDPVLAPRAGYVGSAACGRCHGEILRSWSRTAHNAAVRAFDREGLSGLALVNDADGNGVDDFRDALDLAGTPAFAAYGPDAPRLLPPAAPGAPPRVAIGAVTFPVDRTMGGNGLWRQRFLTRIGNAYHVLPFEFDERTRLYAPHRTEDWYDPADAPRLSRPEDAPADRSFEARCSGCHNTGETLEADPATGGVRTGYVELNVGCEQCHGPGAGHAVQGDVRLILNPRARVDGTAAGAAAANDSCARCHSLGTSTDPLPGGAGPTEFGFRADRGVAAAGDATGDFLVPAEGGAESWGPKVDALPSFPGTTSIAARTDRQHGPDLAAGAHSPRDGASVSCFDCHDPHGRDNPHQVRSLRVEDGVRIPTRSEDNTLCLSCHAGDPRFPGVDASQVAAAASGPAPDTLARAVRDHMRDAGMPIRDGLYDPSGSGVGRCTSCHMPATATGGSFGTDAAGFPSGDLRSHRFEAVWPGASVRHGVTNSCSACHPTGLADAVGEYLSSWASPAAGETAYHGAAPPAAQDGIPLDRASNPARAGGVACVRCHTAEGFARAEVNGEALPQAEIDRIARKAVALERGVTCDACHGRGADGRFGAGGRNPLRLPKAALCDRCHNAESVLFEDFRDRGVLVRHPHAEMVTGSAGEAAPGDPAVATTSHSFLPDRCVSCHGVPAGSGASHSFRPAVAACASCHAGLSTFDRTAGGDYDGDGTVEGIQGEVSGLLDLLRAALLADPPITFAAGRFDRGGATDHALAGATDAQKRAAFNWYSVEDDGSLGVHNAARAVRLLQGSYREITGADVPGADLR